MFDIYIILALSFALSSLYFIHMKGIRKYTEDNPLAYIFAYVIMAFIAFPVLILMWLIGGEDFIDNYGKEVSDSIKEST